MHRFFITDEDVISENVIEIHSEELIHQFTNVLRFETGEQVVFLDGEGNEFISKITDRSKRVVICSIEKKQVNQAEPKMKLVLYQAIPKSPDKFEMVLQKATEVGVAGFVPLITKRTERESLHKVDRLKRILKESAEQSGRGVIPFLEEPVVFEKLLKSLLKGKNVICHTDPSSKNASDFKVDLLNLFIGPEGGFTDVEVEAAKKAGFEVFNAGPRIFRTETAGIVIPALMLS